MLLRQRGDLGSDPQEERIPRDDERTRIALDETRKCSVEFALAAGLRNVNAETERARRRLHIAGISLVTRIAGIDEHTERSGLRQEVMQDADLLLQKLGGKKSDSGDVSAGAIRLVTKPNSMGSPPTLNTIGIVGGRRLCGGRRKTADRGDHRHPMSDQLGRKRRRLARIAPSTAALWPHCGLRPGRSRSSPCGTRPPHPRPRYARMPTTGIAGCCARAASGHAIVMPPSSQDELASLQLIELHPLPLARVAG